MLHNQLNDIELLEKELDCIENRLDEFVIKDIDNHYIVDYLDDRRIMKDKDLKKLNQYLLSKIPMCEQIHLIDYNTDKKDSYGRIGFKITEANYGKFNIDISKYDCIKEYKNQKCLSIITILDENHNFFEIVSNANNYILEKNYKVCGPIENKRIYSIKTNEKSINVQYYEIIIPICG